MERYLPEGPPLTAQTAIAVVIVVVFGVAQYVLMIQALRDLAQRPRVRSGNKVAWGLLILCVPIIGALVYGWMGPTSLIRRPEGAEQPVVRPALRGRTAARRNITPIDAGRRRRGADQRPATSASRRRSRTGS